MKVQMQAQVRFSLLLVCLIITKTLLFLTSEAVSQTVLSLIENAESSLSF